MFYGRINRSRPRITGRRTVEYLRTSDKAKYCIIITHVENIFLLHICRKRLQTTPHTTCSTCLIGV